jgi:hypothetical protein
VNAAVGSSETSDRKPLSRCVPSDGGPCRELPGAPLGRAEPPDAVATASGSSSMLTVAPGPGAAGGRWGASPAVAASNAAAGTDDGAVAAAGAVVAGVLDASVTAAAGAAVSGALDAFVAAAGAAAA